MTLNTKNGIFRPWDEEREGETRAKISSIDYLGVNVKCERADDDDASGQSLSPSPPASASGSSNVQDHEEEEDTLHKLTSLVDRTILGIPTTDHSVDSSSSSCSEASFSPQSTTDEDHSPRSAFVPARINPSNAYSFSGVPYTSAQQRFDAPGGLLHQEMLARQEHAAFDHFAAQQGHYALEEAARLLQHHEAMVKQNKKLRPKKFRCPHCDVAFSNNGQLKGHIRIHTGERPFKCDEEGCGKTFTRNEELTRHKRIHSGVRPHACPACGKRFGRKDHLKKHARTHEMRGPAIYIPAPGPFPFPAHPPLHPFIFGL